MKKLSTGLLLMGLLPLLLMGPKVLAADFTPLIGRWQRPDGGYIIEVRRVDSEGKMEAAYFNPRPINVFRARAAVQKGYIKVDVELRDAGYPGSRYTLVYDRTTDRLMGLYYHAVSRQNFEVVFVRIK